MNPEKVVAEKLAIALSVSAQLRRSLGRNLLAVGACGSVARGTAEKYSDVDLLVLVRKLPPNHTPFRIIKNTYVSTLYETPETIRRQLTRASRDLPEVLGGFTKILAIYDPTGLLEKIENQAARIPKGLFWGSARLALWQSYEDFCRAKNAVLKGDGAVLKDNVDAVAHMAALAVAALNRAHFVSDREIFRAHRRFVKLPKGFERIELLRYGGLRGNRLFNTLLSFYLELVRFCEGQGIRFPVSMAVLRQL